MRILITGGTGFVGRNLVPVLQARGIEAMFFSSSDVDLTQGELGTVISTVKPHKVVHLAGRVGGITDNAYNQKEFLEENLLINTNTIKTVDSFGVPCVSLSSSCCYPVYNLPDEYPLTEEHFYIGGFELTNYTYALAKACMMEQIGLSSNRHVCIIPSNLVGPHDHFGEKGSHFVPAIIHKLTSAVKHGQDKITLLGTGNSLRQFCAVKDLCWFIADLLCEDDKYWKELGKFVNFAPQRNLSIKEAAEIIRDRFAPNVEIVFDKDPTYNGIYRKDISDAKLQKHLATFYAEPHNFIYTSFEEMIDELYESFSNKQHGGRGRHWSSNIVVANKPATNTRPKSKRV